ncbi:phage tail protein [Chroococcidiopsis sp. FACHB-1243]|uniref:phage tail protein n=1 Tax=Chroococcidiopsis sp. [FACHB-1243] TaxID=2692781 RepID=UPI0017855299|nr:phage tail protein [Chroococcidiopsis sp. [FACHB-1243]]MBD2308717.1 phage tail protein [Chroococcidiopsis sp. [FACHB-1243]]
MPQAPEYATASRFYFEAGNVKAPVKEFSNVGIDAPPTEHNMGSDQKGWTYQPLPTPPKPANPTVVIYGSKDKNLYKWYMDCNPNTGGKGKWSSNLRDASITVYDQAGSKMMVWQIKQCYPCKYNVSSLNASGTDILTETIELVPQEIIRES